MARSSPGVFARWEPVPFTITTCSSGTWPISSSTHGSSRSVGSGRVMSGMTIATRSRRAHHVTKRRRAERLAHRVLECRALVRQAGDEPWRDHGDVFRREIDVEAGCAVLEVGSHGRIRRMTPGRTGSPALPQSRKRQRFRPRSCRPSSRAPGAAAGIGSPRVSLFGTATVFIPAACAARSPFGESSKTTHEAGSTPIRSAASRNRSGAGFTCCTSSRVQTASKSGIRLVPLEPRVHPRRRAARCYRQAERQLARLVEALADARQQRLLAAEPPVLVAHEAWRGCRGRASPPAWCSGARTDRSRPACRAHAASRPSSVWRRDWRKPRPRCRTGASRCR